MLEPLNRRHLLEALRPPPGYDLDQAIGTTFSLDLMTLLTVPLAFALRDIEDQNGKPLHDPLALLEAIRRYADRTHIFCQAGGIHLPKGNKLFLSHLENAVHEVVAPKENGIFHPKVWVLRFHSEVEGEPVLYRVLVLSRNLTFDRSWDTLLLLEGELLEREQGFRQCTPLAEFIKALPDLVVGRQPSAAQRASIESVADDLRKVRFDLPPGFEEMTFHPIGLKGSGDWWFEGRIQRMLTIAPFLSPGAITRLGFQGRGNVLVSRLEQLQSLSKGHLEPFGDQIYYLPQNAEPEAEGEEGEEHEHESLSGLHAKLFVADDGRKGRIWTGSANATTAAMSKNVEFLVELTGKKGFCGVDAFLSEKEKETRFKNMLYRYVPDEAKERDSEPDPELDRFKLQLRLALAKSGVRGKVTETKTDLFDVGITLPRLKGMHGVSNLEIRLWPVTLHESAARQIEANNSVGMLFNNLSFDSLTSFVAFEIKAEFNGVSLRDRFVLNVQMTGMPKDRRERVLRSLLKNRERVLQFLLFLLAEEGDIAAYLSKSAMRKAGSAESSGGLFGGTALLEPLVMALHQDPHKIDHVAKVIQDLQKTPEGLELLPDGFMDIWEPVWTARKGIRK